MNVAFAKKKKTIKVTAKTPEDVGNINHKKYNFFLFFVGVFPARFIPEGVRKVSFFSILFTKKKNGEIITLNTNSPNSYFFFFFFPRFFQAKKREREECIHLTVSLADEKALHERKGYLCAYTPYSTCQAGALVILLDGGGKRSEQQGCGNAPQGGVVAFFENTTKQNRKKKKKGVKR